MTPLRNPLSFVSVIRAALLGVAIHACWSADLRPVSAAEIFSSDFSRGSFEKLEWTAVGPWTIVDMEKQKPGIKKNPGLIAKFGATKDGNGTLTKQFKPVMSPKKLVLTFDAGYGWGAANQSQPLQVMLLDENGNGYIFDIHRTNTKWGAQWGVVKNYAFGNPLNWAPAEIDATQKSVVDGGGLRTFTVTRNDKGDWEFNSNDWKGGPLKFSDRSTTTFTQVVLRGLPNTDDLLYNNISLVVE